MKFELDKVLKNEQYEQAAKIRDEIRETKKKLEKSPLPELKDIKADET